MKLGITPVRQCEVIVKRIVPLVFKILAIDLEGNPIRNNLVVAILDLLLQCSQRVFYIIQGVLLWIQRFHVQEDFIEIVIIASTGIFVALTLVYQVLCERLVICSASASALIIRQLVHGRGHDDRDVAPQEIKMVCFQD